MLRRLSQKSFKCENISRLARDMRTITSTVRSAALKAFGTGKEMNIWMGWLPHRANMGLLELKSNKFVTLKYDEQETTRQSTGLYVSRQVAVQYATANAVDLEYGSAVGHRICLKIAGRSTEEPGDYLFNSRARESGGGPGSTAEPETSDSSASTPDPEAADSPTSVPNPARAEADKTGNAPANPETTANGTAGGKEAGASCAVVTECAAGLGCIHFRCAPPLNEGDFCDGLGECVAGLSC